MRNKQIIASLLATLLLSAPLGAQEQSAALEQQKKDYFKCVTNGEFGYKARFAKCAELLTDPDLKAVAEAVIPNGPYYQVETPWWRGGGIWSPSPAEFGRFLYGRGG